jgi:hypothetical protein
MHDKKRKKNYHPRQGSNTSVKNKTRDRYALIIGTKMRFAQTIYLTSINQDLNPTHRESQIELMRVEFAAKLFL